MDRILRYKRLLDFTTRLDGTREYTVEVSEVKRLKVHECVLPRDLLTGFHASEPPETRNEHSMDEYDHEWEEEDTFIADFNAPKKKKPSWEVVRLQQKRVTPDGELWFLVEWKGNYAPSWQPAKNLNFTVQEDQIPFAEPENTTPPRESPSVGRRGAKVRKTRIVSLRVSGATSGGECGRVEIDSPLALRSPDLDEAAWKTFEAYFFPEFKHQLRHGWRQPRKNATGMIRGPYSFFPAVAYERLLRGTGVLSASRKNPHILNHRFESASEVPSCWFDEDPEDGVKEHERWKPRENAWWCVERDLTSCPIPLPDADPLDTDPLVWVPTRELYVIRTHVVPPLPPSPPPAL